MPGGVGAEAGKDTAFFVAFDRHAVDLRWPTRGVPQIFLGPALSTRIDVAYQPARQVHLPENCESAVEHPRPVRGLMKVRAPPGAQPDQAAGRRTAVFKCRGCARNDQGLDHVAGSGAGYDIAVHQCTATLTEALACPLA